ncbi:Uncharacterized protein APZ42_017906 [Daphnia magna]|uniref:Uncharacterized protein n=1 Tax=Daphnia magna TaxID=35525 RepID=A0A164ZDY7_9CRUS|nr:Uncharacterized protein APZ42_017906 [Daphnia magna]
MLPFVVCKVLEIIPTKLQSNSEYSESIGLIAGFLGTTSITTFQRRRHLLLYMFIYCTCTHSLKMGLH